MFNLFTVKFLKHSQMLIKLRCCSNCAPLLNKMSSNTSLSPPLYKLMVKEYKALFYLRLKSRLFNNVKLTSINWFKMAQKLNNNTNEK